MLKNRINKFTIQFNKTVHQYIQYQYNIPGRVLKEYVLTNWHMSSDLFNNSPNQAVISSCLKTVTIIPVPKKLTKSKNDYRLIALTPIMMKSFERLVKDHIISRLLMLDPFQFTYQA